MRTLLWRDVDAARLPESLVRSGSHIFFALNDLAYGAEVWALPLSVYEAGDCDGGGVVTIDELITGVAIAAWQQAGGRLRGVRRERRPAGDHRRAGDCSARGPHWV